MAPPKKGAAAAAAAAAAAKKVAAKRRGDSSTESTPIKRTKTGETSAAATGRGSLVDSPPDPRMNDAIDDDSVMGIETSDTPQASKVSSAASSHSLVLRR